MIADLICRRCGEGFRQLGSEPFVTCPGCRLYSKPGLELHIRKEAVPDRFRKPNHVDDLEDDNPSYENARRALEG